MNRQRYRLVFSTSLGALVAVAESARGRGKAASGTRRAGALLAGALLAVPAFAQKLPTISPGGALPAFVTYGQANYLQNGSQAFVNQVGNKAILNWQNFNIAPGHGVQFRQVDGLATGNLVPGASFTTLNRIWDANPSVIYGNITQGEGQKGNIILVNTNGIAFMGGSQVNLNSFTASSLDIADKYILNTLLPGDDQPQYQGTGGFVKVFEGAQITAGEQGRIMLIAPTVINQGSLSAAGGQVVLAAGTKAYLRTASAYGDSDVRGLVVEVDSPAGLASYDAANTSVKDIVLDGQTVDLTDPALDLLGNATNLGQLTASTGNVTMVGLAVNQLGLARATTSVVANGTVYLMASDTYKSPGAANLNSPGSRSERAGRVTLGTGSVTEVVPEVADATTSLDWTETVGAVKTLKSDLQNKSRVQILGNDVRLATGSTVRVPAGVVDITAVDKPLNVDGQGTNPFTTGGIDQVSGTARVHVADGAVIDVSGLSGVQVSAERNTVEAELRGDELKDSPVNRNGALRGEKVYLDVERALARARSGESTLIAEDSLLAYQARLGRTVAERSTQGGTVNIQSQGEVILETGSTINLSGGTVEYTPATVKSTLLFANGKRVEVSEADANVKYDGIASRYVIDHGLWNVKEVIDLGEYTKYDPGYTDGKAAGALNIVGMGGTVLQSAIQGKTVVGERQLAAGTAPQGARLQVGSASAEGDYKNFQQVRLGHGFQQLPISFSFGDVLSADLKNQLLIDTGMLGEDLIAGLTIYSNKNAVVEQPVSLPDVGSLSITASAVAVNADVSAAGGVIKFNARGNQADPNNAFVLEAADVVVAPGVTLSTAGKWVNERVGFDDPARRSAVIDGGSVTLSAIGDTVLGSGSTVDVSGGAWLQQDGTLKYGSGGSATVVANETLKTDGPLAGRVELNGRLLGFGFEGGGTLNLSSGSVQIGGQPTGASNALFLQPEWFSTGGFENITITGREGVTLADGAVLAPQLRSRELNPGFAVQTSGTDVASMASLRVLPPDERSPVNLTLVADSNLLGDVTLGTGSRTVLDTGGSLTLNAAHQVSILGSVQAHAGHFAAKLSAPLDKDFDASSSIFLGEAASLDVSGTALTHADATGQPVGKVLDGGSVRLNASTGYVIAKEGSSINVSGAAPVYLAERNEAGGLGRNVASSAGSVSIAAREGLALDGTLLARAGAADQSGGSLAISLGNDNAPTPSPIPFPVAPSVLSVESSLPAQAQALQAGQAIPVAFSDQTRLDIDRIEAAGFEQIALGSKDAIRLQDGVNIGGGRTMPLRSVSLDSPLIDMAGGTARVTAALVRMGNQSTLRQSVVNTPVAGGGVLSVDATRIEVVGKSTLSGVAETRLNASGQIELSGVNVDSVGPLAGALNTAGDLTFTAKVLAPATYSDFEVSAPGQTVNIVQAPGVAQQPLSAFGRLRIEAGQIEQKGTLWAPLGRIELEASGSLTLAPGSLTSVSAQAGTVLPFGTLENGREWSYGDILSDLPEKSISLKGAQVDFQSGAQVSVAGGGDAQAYEFTVGPGGSKDFLAQADTFAVMPGYTGGFAPNDAQEGFALDSGAAVYLRGVNGLPDGVYTLLPAHYALLPGAFAVRLNQNEFPVLPGSGYTRADGVQVASGYLTDSRSGAPRSGDWQGIQVLTRDQVRDRSEYTLSAASSFFADSRFSPQDAGRLAVVSLGTGPDSLRLNGVVAAQGGAGGAGAAVDIAAANLRVSGSADAAAPGEAWVATGWLNDLGAESLLLGGTRSRSQTGAVLDVLADTVTLANDAQSALSAPEVMLVARDTLTLAAGSAINAQGAVGNAGSYSTAGNGAFVRAASSSASFTRTGSPDRSQGTLIGAADSVLQAARAIAIDATQDNAFAGQLAFVKEGVAVAGELSAGSSRINFGSPAKSVDGLTFSQSELEGLQSLDSLALTSYSTFDFHGDVDVGGVGSDGQPLIKNLTLQGAGLAGFGAAGQTASLRARNLTLANTAGVAYATPAGLTLGSGSLEVLAQTLTLGEGQKAVSGFANVGITADELVASGTGSTQLDNGASVTTARLTGTTGASQKLDAGTQALILGQMAPSAALAETSSLGAAWELKAGSVRFDTQADLGGGALTLAAVSGDVTLGANADIDVSGRSVTFFDQTRSIGGGKVTLSSATGKVVAQTDALTGRSARIDVSGGAGADGGTLVATAVQGTVDLDGATLVGQTSADADGHTGEAAKVRIDAGSLANFSALNAQMNAGGFEGERSLRARSGALTVAATDMVRAQKVTLTADSGALTVNGTVSASGAEGGQVALYGQSVTLTGTARVEAAATSAGGDGGRVVIGAATQASDTAAQGIDLQAGSVIDVSGGAGGEVHLRAQRKGNDVAVTALDSTIKGAREVTLEAVRVYDNKTTLNASTTDSGTTLGLTKIKNDNNAYASNNSAIKNRLDQADNADFHVVSGVEVRSAGAMTLGADWNFKDATAGGEAGVLTLRAGGNLNINNNLSDGFSTATKLDGANPATLQDASVRGGNAWSFNLVAGADASSADVMNTQAGGGDLTLAAAKLIRTGSGDIRMAAGQDIVLKANTSAVYTAGTRYTPSAGFVVPGLAQFSQGGGDIEMTAQRDVLGVASAQLYSNWLFRQGKLGADGVSYVANAQPAWWVRFDKFEQGVATLAGGDVNITAGGKVSNLSASAATQGYITSAVADVSAAVRTGGGDVNVTAGGDVLSGQYYADLGDVNLKAGGSIRSGYAVSSRPVHTILAVGDGSVTATALGDVDVHAIINPHLVVQSSTAGFNIGTTQASNAQWSVFSTYAEDSSASLLSATGDVRLFGGGVGSSAQVQSLANAYKAPVNLSLGAYADEVLLAVLPPSLSAVALSGDVSLLSGALLSPAAQGKLELLASENLNVPARITLSDTVPLPNAVNPSSDAKAAGVFSYAYSAKSTQAHAAVPVHANDADPVRLYAVNGSILGNNQVLKSAKRVSVRAGEDILNLPMDIQHVSANDISVVEAGNDIALSPVRSSNSYVAVSGPGRLEMTAGHDIDLGASAGVLSRGTLDNPALPDGGADLHLAAGVGAAGLDPAGAVNRLANELADGVFSDATLWLARWLTGDDTLSREQALQRVQEVAAAAPDVQRTRVREMLFNGIRQTGRIANIPNKPEKPNPYAGNFSRAYLALEMVFPGMGTSLATGAYQGTIDVFASRIKTEQGGNIELLVPGGGVVVGLSNTPEALVTPLGSGKDTGPLGIITVGAGDIRMLARDDVLVNQSRVLTAAGGDILIWSSEGDIDAGKGKKTATAVPPPVIKTDSDGNVTQEIQAAAAGSGIGALSTNGITAGDVDLIAPKGTVNAGDGGIRAGNLNIAAQVVLGSENISVSGKSAGTPVADTSAVTASASGATSAGDDLSKTTAALSQSAADSAKNAQSLADSLKPSFVRVDVLGFGE
ncbi:MAG: filamentous hemagglutinin family protein [Rhodoferax sp.]|uniref:filamentous haemagglutinin family protein n=1 Tax=Rhodoferax sp. TaxID=50421 RepID=UPI00271A7143|nr:filamentous haemagglutinin family protein [Rhodoferax sp.]MDO8450817.1 filamentous hemagglutinin family protein [Rhodoferax sp.]